MENVLYGRRLARRYDLKGLEKRMVHDEEADAVLFDGNMVDTLRHRPLYVDQYSFARMTRALWIDTTFLARLNVMDYSLLVGVDEDG